MRLVAAGPSGGGCSMGRGRSVGKEGACVFSMFAHFAAFSALNWLECL